MFSSVWGTPAHPSGSVQTSSVVVPPEVRRAEARAYVLAGQTDKAKAAYDQLINELKVYVEQYSRDEARKVFLHNLLRGAPLPKSEKLL